MVGVILLWNSMLDLFGWILPDFFREILWSLQNLLPRLAIAVLILYAGVRMLRGTPVKKRMWRTRTKTRRCKKWQHVGLVL